MVRDIGGVCVCVFKSAQINLFKRKLTLFHSNLHTHTHTHTHTH